MRVLLVTMICTAVLAIGCNKNKKDVANQNDSASSMNVDDASRAQHAPARTQTATGEMRELLLALKRVHFPLDASTLGPSARNALDDAAEKLRSLIEVDLYVDGHTDERGTTEYNMSLSERRAKTVVDYLKNVGVEPGRLSVVSFGEEIPMAAGAGRRQYAMNRRVEFRLMKGDIRFVLADGDLVDDDGTPLVNMDREEDEQMDAEEYEE